MTSANGMDRPCSRPHRLSKSDGASKDTRSTSNVPDDKRCIRQHHWHRYRQEHLHLIGLDEQGMIVLREKLARGRIGGRLANVPPCLIGIEAGMGTHYVARELISLGHDVEAGAASLSPSRSAKPTRTTSGTLTRSRKPYGDMAPCPSRGDFRCGSVATEAYVASVGSGPK